jgi:hypothetical protein
MAIDPSNDITYFLSVAVGHKDYLGAIRHYSNLKIAFEEGLVWVKDLTSVQLDSIEVKSIPYKQLYYSSGPKLFLKGSLLPSRGVPSLLWTPIERGLPVRLPSFNHNYFGIQDKAGIRVIASVNEVEAIALMVDLQLLENYLETAPAVRLKNLSWTIVEDRKALILGTPLLPLQGKVFWRRDDFLLPAGYDLELPVLCDTIHKELNPGKEHWIIWNKDDSYKKLDKRLFRPLSIYSFRLSSKKVYGGGA